MLRFGTFVNTEHYLAAQGKKAWYMHTRGKPGAGPSTGEQLLASLNYCFKRINVIAWELISVKRRAGRGLAVMLSN